MKIFVEEKVVNTSLTTRVSSDISNILAKACSLYFQLCYKLLQNDVTETTVKMTPFHLALADKDNNQLIDLIQKEINDDKVFQFVLNAKTQDDSADFTVDEDYVCLPKHLCFIKTVLPHMDEDEKLCIYEYSKSKYDIEETNYAGENSMCKNAEVTEGITFELPLALCASSGNLTRFRSLVQLGADIFGVDRNGNNIVHTLVLLSRDNPQTSLEFYRATMDLCKSESEKQLLLLTCNVKGFHPLDLAAKMCLPEIFKEIFLTDDVYRFVSRECLSHQHVLYDVSEYERVHNQRYHPLCHIIGMTDEDVSRADACGFFKFAPLQKWIDNKKARSCFDLILFGMFWVTFYLLSLAQQIIYAQTGDFVRVLEMFMIAFAADAIITELILIILHFTSLKRFLQNLLKAKFPATFTTGYRIFQSAFCWNIIVAGSLRFAGFHCSHYITIQALHIHAAATGVVSILFFAQLVNSLGHIMMMFQRMLYDTMVFFQIGFMVFFAPALSMYLLHNGPVCEYENGTEIYRLRNDSTVFSTLPRSMYEMFLHMFSITPPNPLYFREAIIPGLAQALYLFTILLGSILLLNLLIGIMGQRVTEITNHKETLLLLEQLSISMLAVEQKSMSILISRILGKWFYRWNLRHFRHNTDLSKVYVEVIENRNSKITCTNQNTMTCTGHFSNIKS